MEETTEVPQDADCTKITLSQKNTSKNQETAQQKEQEYLKKAQDQYQSELSGHLQHNTKYNLKHMQKQLDTIYVNLCRDYIKKKKEQVKNFKQ